MPKMILTVVAALALAVPATAAATPAIKHVWIVLLENENYQDSFQHPDRAPYLARDLPSQGALLRAYYGIGHESLDNYIALVSGQSPNADTQSDCQFYRDLTPATIGADGQAIGQGCVYPAAAKTVADQLAARGLSWRGYMEDMGTPCRHPALNSHDTTQSARVGDQYAARHNPFVYFHSIIDSPACAANDLPLSRLPADLASGTPSYSFVTPNLCHDGHDSPCVDGEAGGLTSADGFLRQWVPRILGSAAYRAGGLLVITFDEASSGLKGSDSSACCGEPIGPNSPDPGGPAPGPGGGKVGAVLLSPYIRAGTVDDVPYNHYALLRSVEDIFGLAHLGYAGLAAVRPFGGDVFNAAPGGTGGNAGRGGAGARRARLRVRIAGVARGCVRRDFTIRVSARGGRVRLLTVTLDGRRVGRTRRSHTRLRVDASRLRAGRHRIGATAAYHGRGRAAAHVTFDRCAQRRPAFAG